MTARPHDALFRSAFERAEDAEGELRSVLPVAVTAAIDWATLRREPGSFVDRALADRHADLLFSAQIRGERALVYLLLEHQSTCDPLMPLRILVYLVRIWERCARDAPDALLPAIIPIVVSHQDGGWTAATRMHEIVAARSIAIPELARNVPDFEFLVDDLASTSHDALRARALELFPMLALWLLRDGRSAETLIAALDRWAAAFHAVATAPSGAASMVRLLRYLDLVLSEEHFERFRGKLVELAPATKEAAMTYGERMERQGLEQGREQGLEQGRRELLLEMLAFKFGPLPQDVIDRVAAGRTDELHVWATRLLAAARLDDVLGG